MQGTVRRDSIASGVRKSCVSVMLIGNTVRTQNSRGVGETHINRLKTRAERERDGKDT
jgi:hypothetical protein